MTSFTLLLSKKLFLPPQKAYQLFLLALNSQKKPFGRNSVTYRTPCHARGHFVFLLSPCYLQDTTPCHACGHLVIYRECQGFERVFFTLRRFLPYTPSCQFQGLPGAGSLTLKLAGFQLDIFETQPRPDYLFESQQFTKRFKVVGQFKSYGWLGDHVNNLLLTGFEPFS